MGGGVEHKERILDIVLGVFLVLLIITTAALILPAWRNYRKVYAEELEQRRQLEAARQERQEYLERRNRLEHSPEEVEKVAREKYNFTRKGEVVMSFPAEKTASPEPGGKKRQKN